MALKKLIKPWKLREKVVAMLEQHLDHGALVEHDVWLPVLNSKKGKKRQCDVVITKGDLPRQTITIVEVQKKKGQKPTINEFEGWLKKMERVGAQHLICVSEKGFPDSILEEAVERGPTVRLLTLKQLEEGGNAFLPPDLFNDTLEVVTYERLVGFQCELEHLVRIDPKKDPNRLPDPFEKCFKPPGRDDEVSPTDIVDFHLFGAPGNMKELPKTNELFTLGIRYEYGFNEGFQYRSCDQWVFVHKLAINIELRIRSVPIGWISNQYEQIGWGEVGWVLRGVAEYDGVKSEIIVPLKKIEPGLYSAGRPMSVGHAEAFIAYGDVGYKAVPIDH